MTTAGDLGQCNSCPFSLASASDGVALLRIPTNDQFFMAVMNAALDRHASGRKVALAKDVGDLVQCSRLGWVVGIQILHRRWLLARRGMSSMIVIDQPIGRVAWSGALPRVFARAPFRRCALG